MNRGRRPGLVSHSASYGVDRDFAPPASFKPTVCEHLGRDDAEGFYRGLLDIIACYREESADEQSAATADDAHVEAVRLRSAASKFSEALRLALDLPENGGLARSVRLTADKRLRDISTTFATGRFETVVSGRHEDETSLIEGEDDPEADLLEIRSRLGRVTLEGLESLMVEVGQALELAATDLAPSNAGRKLGQAWTEWIRRLANLWLAVTQTPPTAKKDPIDPERASRFVSFVQYLQRELQAAEDRFADTVQPVEALPARRERQLRDAGYLRLNLSVDLSSRIALELKRWRENPTTRGNFVLEKEA